jgi:peptidoglycan hydrolase-like protein with peptidoglycan-binding domain
MASPAVYGPQPPLGTKADRASTTSTAESGQVCPYPLRTRLPDMQPRPDGPHRGNTAGRQLIGERLRSAPVQRVAVDGLNGDHTYQDVRSFQKDAGIKVDGEIGPQTWYYMCRYNYLNLFAGTYWHDAGCNTEPGL